MTAETPDRFVVGRHSIRDRQCTVVAYELHVVAGSQDPAAAPLRSGLTGAALSAAVESGLHRVSGNERVFLPADRDLLLDAATAAVLPEHAVLEVPGELSTDDEIVRACGLLVDAGHPIALDAFTWPPASPRLLALAGVVSLDARTADRAALPDVIGRLRDHDVELLAANVETSAQFHELLALGFELFQGNATHRPNPESGEVPTAAQLARLRMAAGMLGETLDFDEIEDVLRTEPGLTYQVLQLASIGRPGENRRRVHSLREALVLAGTWRVQGWIAMLVSRPSDAASDETVDNALARARACELLGPAVGATPRLGFAAGMLSTFEQLLQIPSADLSDTLPLSDELRAAAFGDQAPMGRLVSDVAELQDGVAPRRGLSGLSHTELATAVADGFRWALEARAALDEL